MTPEPARAVQLFVTCLIETLRPEAGMAVVRLLEQHDIRIEYPCGQTCCGQPAFNAGAWDDARAMACYTLEVLSKSNAPILVPSGSCADMLVHHYPELLANDSKYGPLAEEVAARTFEFAQFLSQVLEQERGAGREVPAPALAQRSEARGAVGTRLRVTYHPSCHLLRGLGIVAPPRELLQRVEGVELVELPGATECCGFGGLFSIKMSEISSAMLQRKLDAIQSTGAEIVVSCDISCLLHIGGGLHRRGSSIQTKHLAEILSP